VILVGTFHRINYIPFNSHFSQNVIMAEARKNPLVGMLRHSPSIVATRSTGLKGILEDKEPKNFSLTPLIPGSSSATSTTAPSSSSTSTTNKDKPLNFVASLREIPHSHFSTNSSQNGDSEVAVSPGSILSPLDLINNDPICAICMETYENGDELLTLACSHCFHSDCVSKWFYQDCLNSENMISNFKCPRCRREHHSLASSASNSINNLTAAAASVSMKNHVGTSTIPSTEGTKQQHTSSSTASVDGDDSSDRSVVSSVGDHEGGGISSTSLLQLGQNLLDEGGYDLLNDLDLSSIENTPRDGKAGSRGPFSPKSDVSRRSREAHNKINNKNSNFQMRKLLYSCMLGGSTYSDCGVPAIPPPVISSSTVSTSCTSQSAAPVLVAAFPPLSPARALLNQAISNTKNE
jgi:hypothetical protein